MDFDRGGSLTDLLVEFMSELNLLSCDLSFRNNVNFTYERNDGVARSWIDHIVCTQSFSSQVSNVYTLRTGSNLSDHFPMFFLLHVNCLTMHSTPLPSSSVLSYNTPNIDWSKVTLHDIEKYQEMVTQCLSSLLPEIVNCCDVA